MSEISKQMAKPLSFKLTKLRIENEDAKLEISSQTIEGLEKLLLTISNGEELNISGLVRGLLDDLRKLD